jgi:FKBP-type peptidyl-prolyl cis-trans isomerase SlyD
VAIALFPRKHSGKKTYMKVGSNNQTIPVRIMEVKKDVVVMNFNHPLAGKTLNFEAEIIEIK